MTYRILTLDGGGPRALLEAMSLGDLSPLAQTTLDDPPDTASLEATSCPNAWPVGIRPPWGWCA
ncbi:hypothetical protein [Nitrospirillum sp. BR 11163]|uniref:hypothetical protein n=1 Tax=Nitrospirillum sp. BR 11163 TaxID=3104323 RepID=UPI002B003ABB|nr:hypothetical protein [Nitrospirillum sp. BR 11163]MEA1674420.1 hypothetical protein [Nitrospirillum sp. BR 11163]